MKRYFTICTLAMLPFAGFAQPAACFVSQFVDSAAACLAIYQPVCGCDGMTYGNDCEALYHHGITAFVPGECQEIVGPCNATAAVAARFHVDAKFQAFHRQITGLGDSVNIPITDSLYQRVLKSLISVYQLTGNPARDEVFGFMHSFRRPYYRSNAIYLAVDTAEIWGKNIENGIQPSGDPVVDNLMSTYQLKGRKFITSMGKRVLILDSPFSVNTYALSKAFSGASGFVYAEPSTLPGDGDRMEIQSWGNPMIIDFSYGWGDCWAGCIYRHYWQFSIDENCQAAFIKSWGAPLPALPAEEPSFVKRFELFGQPGNPSVRLQVELASSMPVEIRVWNSFGQLHQQYRFASGQIDETLHWETASPGLYLFELVTAHGRAVRKVLR